MQLPDQLICDWVHGSFGPWTWTPPAVPDLAGPHDLAKVLVSYRSKLEEIRQEIGRSIEGVGGVLNDGLERLLAYAYRASFLADEGRPVTARLFVPEARLDSSAGVLARRWQEWRESQTDVHRFKDSIALDDPKLMARLAVTLQSEDSALIIREDSNDIAITGIALLDCRNSKRPLLGMPQKDTARLDYSWTFWGQDI